MKFTLKWLKEYLDTNATMEEICDKLDQIGLEIEEIIESGKSLKDFKCVFVEDVQNHENSDHLHVCKVKTFDEEELQIVCGAPNVKKGMKTILAPVGALIPNSDFKITKSKIRGVESYGMLCSEKELGIGSNHEGIIELEANTEIGKNIAEIKNIDDVVIDINITPNRGDCLGIYGIARDLSATGIGKLKEFKNYKIEGKTFSPVKLEIQNKNCSQFAIRYIKNVKNCESPKWIKEKLKAIGINPKSALVDITNYVMLVLNRPLHCYDANKIFENIIVNEANGGEKFLALDSKEYSLNKGDITISDSGNNILGLGGIIGGDKSASLMETTDVVLECAVFNPITIATTSRTLNIITDAKYRFERGVDPSSTELAINYATHLILSICGGENSDLVKGTPCSSNHLCKNGISELEENKTLDFNISSVENILGLKIERENIINILSKLGYKIKENTNNLDNVLLIIPSWRNDILIKENVVEDIIRIYGYDNLKESKITHKKIGEDLSNISNKAFYDKLWEITSLMASKNMTEIISWSFMEKNLASEFSVINSNLILQNPISSELSYMRPTIIPNLMTIAKYNQDRSIESVSLFEKGKIFIEQTPNGQSEVIAGIRSGLTCKKNIFNDSRLYDIYDVKKDLFDILKIFGISGDSLTITNDVPDYYHSARSGAVKMGNIILGIFGEIHPLKTKKIGLKNKVNAFELYLNNLPKIKTQKITQKKKYLLNDLQPIYRDFAFILDSSLEIGKVINSIKKTNKELIKEVHIFDIYEGDNVDNKKKSVAFSIKIQPLNKTLTSNEIEAISNKIIKEITEKFNGILRDK